jgi:hypothetical protein
MHRDFVITLQLHSLSLEDIVVSFTSEGSAPRCWLNSRLAGHQSPSGHCGKKKILSPLLGIETKLLDNPTQDFVTTSTELYNGYRVFPGGKAAGVWC